MRFLFFLIILFSLNFYSQCSNCFKNFGGWTNEEITDIKSSNDGISFLVTGDGFYSPRIVKQDFNCNTIWEKEIQSINSFILNHTIDNNGNYYILIDYGRRVITTSVGPWIENGITFYRGLNLLKLSPTGNLLWIKHIGDNTGITLTDIYYHNNQIIIASTFKQEINLLGQIQYNFNERSDLNF
ncbi:MAG: hypothetical protein QM535_13605 [Limnohabitans sp.]|nr:hypothetical protein [Limnohabitans sp.]